MDINNLNIKSVEIITLPKTGSSSCMGSLKKIYNVNHCHSLKHLKDILQNSKNTLIISGVRNPIEMIISLFFYGYDKPYLRDQSSIRMKINDYKGQKLYYDTTQSLIIHNSLDKLANQFFSRVETNGECNLNLFNDWIKEYLEITNIKEFDKKKGYQLYKLNNNNYIFLYRFENIISSDIFIDFFKIPFSHEKNIKDINYIKKITEFKNYIKFDKNDMNSFFNTDYVKFFYSDKEIEIFCKKYEEK